FAIREINPCRHLPRVTRFLQCSIGIARRESRASRRPERRAMEEMSTAVRGSERRRASVSPLLGERLAVDAQRRLRDRAQTLRRDRLAARLAYPIAAGSDPGERVLDRAQLVDVAADLRQIEVDEKIRDRSVVRVRALLNQIGELLILVLLELAANVFPQLAAALSQPRLELRDIDILALRHRPAPV